MFEIIQLFQEHNACLFTTRGKSGNRYGLVSEDLKDKLKKFSSLEQDKNHTVSNLRSCDIEGKSTPRCWVYLQYMFVVGFSDLKSIQIVGFER